VNMGWSCVEHGAGFCVVTHVLKEHFNCMF
jgi:hypothetical protein